MNVDDLGNSMTVNSPGEETYLAIRRAVLEGELRPGERIVEQQVAETLNVSRTPVREALLKLERENLVARVGRGMSVRRYLSSEVRDIYDLRAQIEGYAARVACERVIDPEINALERVQEKLEEELERSYRADIQEPHTLAQLNQRFHALLIRAARNASLERCFAQVLQLPLLYKAYLWYDEESKRSSAAEHRRLIELLRERAGNEAEVFWRHHIERGRDVLAEHLTASEAGELLEGAGA